MSYSLCLNTAEHKEIPPRVFLIRFRQCVKIIFNCLEVFQGNNIFPSFYDCIIVSQVVYLNGFSFSTCYSLMDFTCCGWLQTPLVNASCLTHFRCDIKIFIALDDKILLLVRLFFNSRSVPEIAGHGVNARSLVTRWISGLPQESTAYSVYKLIRP